MESEEREIRERVREGQREKGWLEEPQYFIRTPASTPCIMRLRRIPPPGDA
jgi:hypothetical protein